MRRVRGIQLGAQDNLDSIGIIQKYDKVRLIDGAHGMDNAQAPEVIRLH